MKFIADLHVHSKFSRATARNLDLEHLYIGAQLKGITVVATGDFTHPAWFAEIQEKLVPAEPGLFRLREEIARDCDAQVPASCQGPVRFILESEISNIYKKNGKTRKNHNLIYVPDLDTASRLNAKLDAIGNIRSDGRPILGLDARNLLEIMLECSEDAFLIPAHIWTPWFSLLGSKSGFDSLAECFEDLSPEIFAVETGLSSDAPMNWRVSELDSRTLVSNSDAHSPANLGRNANRFDTDLSFPAIRAALKAKDSEQCMGTLDMYPEEGKYHMDGHRKCDICLLPVESIAKEGICPVCEKPLTLGVLHRVEALADRPEGTQPENGLPYRYIIPLLEILSEIFNVGPKTKTVAAHYQTALETLGPELDILLNCPADRIRKAGIPLLDEAVRRMRAGEIHISPGYDGEYGTITVFTPDEKETLLGQQSLFDIPGQKKPGRKKKKEVTEKVPKRTPSEKADADVSPSVQEPIGILDALNDEQRQAAEHTGGPLLIVAGPGAGKTRTLTHRIAWLIRERKVAPDHILAVTFTNKAAREMAERVTDLLSTQADAQNNQPVVATFHALCLMILQTEAGENAYMVIDEDERKLLTAEAVRQVQAKARPLPLTADRLADLISSAKQYLLTPSDDLAPVAGEEGASLLARVYQTYQDLLARQCVYDYDDLIFNVVRLFDTDDGVRERYAKRFEHILVDEYQDLNLGQYRIVKALSPPDKELCVIGDPDQSIYGFRGSDVRYFKRFSEDYPTAKTVLLTRNYRSTEAILEASHQIIRHHSINPAGARVWSGIQGIRTLTILELATDRAEAVAVGKTIERMVGGTGFHSIDFDKTDETGMKTDRAFSDFAVLYRTNAQGQVIKEILESAGIPCQITRKENIYGQKGVAELISLLKLIQGAGIFSDLEKVVRTEGAGIGSKTLGIFQGWFYENDFTVAESLAAIKERFVAGMTESMQQNLRVFADRISEFREKLTGKSVREKLDFLLDHTGLRSVIGENLRREEALARLLQLADAFDEDISEFFRMIALQTDPDMYDIDVQKVALMTLHSAKGLEFPVVFITGCEQGFLPYRRSEDEAVDEDEERRLFYVGMTRAKEQLFLTCAKKRVIYGKTVDQEASPFVRDIEERLITLEKIQAGKAKKEIPVQLGLFN